jgi:arylsulfatase A-like enzyme
MKPNIVFIIADNQSPWTLGCYGNDEILTPNIDRLANNGIRFTNAFCSNPVCSPNRATCLTGLMPSQHGVHNWLGAEKPDAQMGPDAYCAIEEFANLPGLLAADGYNCGLSGKWHLGDSMNPQLGFKYWFTKPKGHTSTFYNDEAIWEGEVHREEGYYLDAITEHAVDFIRQERETPFFLYVGYNGPYGLDHDMREGHRNRHTDYYSDKEMTSFPREGVHPWLRQNTDCIENMTTMRSYACATSGVDDGVGRILDSLSELELERNTLVVYTADHGLCAGHNGYWGMSDHGRPLMMYDTNLRVPLILRHPQRIPAGGGCDAAVCNYDFFPSILEYLDLTDKHEKKLAMPGKSYAAALAGDTLSWEQQATFHEYENTRTIRTPEWKLTRRFPGGPHDLYDLRNDPWECRNLIDQPQHSDVQLSLKSRLETFFGQHADPKYDLWTGGRSKAGRAIPEPEEFTSG